MSARLARLAQRTSLVVVNKMSIKSRRDVNGLFSVDYRTFEIVNWYTMKMIRRLHRRGSMKYAKLSADGGRYTDRCRQKQSTM